jgi:hypothetical protein
MSDCLTLLPIISRFTSLDSSPLRPSSTDCLFRKRFLARSSLCEISTSTPRIRSPCFTVFHPLRPFPSVPPRATWTTITPLSRRTSSTTLASNTPRSSTFRQRRSCPEKNSTSTRWTRKVIGASSCSMISRMKTFISSRVSASSCFN